MSKFKKFFALLLALSLALALLAGCGGNGDPNKPNGGNGDEPPKEYTGAYADGGITYADPEWLPVVKQPITVSAYVRDPALPNDNWPQRSIFEEIANTTGVRFEVELISSQANELLIYASRNYPDCAFRMYESLALQEACYAGDVMEFTDEILEKYAPNWLKVFQEYPEIYRMSLKSNGKLYSFPQMKLDESTYALRDGYVINYDYLDQLGMEVPTTLNEFTEYLRAVKNAAGTGIIPSDVAPMYIRLKSENIGSFYSFLDWFGVYNGVDYEIVDNGVVKNQGQNEMIIPACRYIAQIYNEGLFNADCNTGDWTAYQDIINSGGGFGAAFVYSMSEKMKQEPEWINHQPPEDYEVHGYVWFPPLDCTQNGAKGAPYVRDFGMEQRIVKNAFQIFTTSKYPIALIRAMDHYASGEAAVRFMWGEQGEDEYSGKQWYYAEDGRPCNCEHAWLNDGPGATKTWGFNDYGPSFLDAEAIAGLNRYAMDSIKSRDWGYYTYYKEHVPTDKSIYPKEALNYLTEGEYNEFNSLHSLVTTAVRSKVVKYARGQVDPVDDWDNFQNQLKQAGIDRMLEIMQAGYDRYMSYGVD